MRMVLCNMLLRLKRINCISICNIISLPILLLSAFFHEFFLFFMNDDKKGSPVYRELCTVRLGVVLKSNMTEHVHTQCSLV
jgi:hypothetical protein